MRSLTATEAARWCRSQGLGSDRGLPRRPARIHEFAIPSDAGQRVALVAEHLRPFSSGTALVWFDDWAVWPSGQRMHAFERFRASYGEDRPLIEIPAFLFSRSEFEDLASFVTIGVLFLWDVHVTAARGRSQLFFSHGEIGWKSA